MNEIINQYFDLSQMSKHFDEVLDGFVITLELSVIAGALALLWGLVLALLRQLPGKALMPVRFLTIAYIDVFRGDPAADPDPADLRQPRLPASCRKRSRSRTGSANRTPSGTGSMALTITYGAYMAEVYRAGIEAVPGGQMEAARSLGMSHRQAMRNVIVPQAVRKVIAPMLNEFIALLKDTTLVSVIALNEVVLVGRDIQSQDLQQLGADARRDHVPGRSSCPLARLVDRLIAREQARNLTRGAAHRVMRTEPMAGADAQAGGDPQALRRPRGAARDRPRGRAGRSRLRDRAERLRQEHAAALHQPARAARGGRDLPRGPRHLQGARVGQRRAGWELDFVRQRVGMVFQQFNLFPHRTALQNVTMAPEKVLGRSQRGGAGEGQRRCSSGSASPTSSTSTPNGSRAASSSGSRSPGRWRWTRT